MANSPNKHLRLVTIDGVPTGKRRRHSVQPRRPAISEREAQILERAAGCAGRIYAVSERLFVALRENDPIVAQALAREAVIEARAALGLIEGLRLTLRTDRRAEP